ncbi:MAG: PorT family protein, partial [Bacteroidota bacterium]
MKKIVILLVFLSSSISLLAQESNRPRFGLQLSPTFSWMRSDLNIINGNGANVGLKLGMLAEFSPNFLGGDARYAITTGLGFAFNHGGTLQYTDRERIWIDTPDLEVDPLNAKYSVQYIEVPVGFKMRFCMDHIRTCIFAEPQMVLGFRGQSRGDIVNQIDLYNDLTINEFISPLGVSWGLGIGAEYGIGGSTALIGGI